MWDQFELLMALLAATIWLGAMIFLSFIIAPMVFRVLSPIGASHFLRALFPRYYRFGIVCSTLLVSLLAYQQVASPGSAPLLLGTLLGGSLILLLTVYSLFLVPRINAARDAGDTDTRRFETLHRRSVIINGLNLLLTLAVIIAVGVMAVSS